MSRTRPLAFCVTVALFGIVRAEIVEFSLAPLPSPAFEKSFQLQPKKVAEACTTLKPEDTVAWTFESATMTNFNIHYHVGKDVRYVEERNAVKQASATLRPPSAQAYCWMWTNTAATAIEIRFRASRAP